MKFVTLLLFVSVELDNYTHIVLLLGYMTDQVLTGSLTSIFG